jgi:hypothetical protein
MWQRRENIQSLGFPEFIPQEICKRGGQGHMLWKVTCHYQDPLVKFWPGSNGQILWTGSLDEQADLNLDLKKFPGINSGELRIFCLFEIWQTAQALAKICKSLFFYGSSFDLIISPCPRLSLSIINKHGFQVIGWCHVQNKQLENIAKINLRQTGKRWKIFSRKRRCCLTFSHDHFSVFLCKSFFPNISYDIIANVSKMFFDFSKGNYLLWYHRKFFHFENPKNNFGYISYDIIANVWKTFFGFRSWNICYDIIANSFHWRNRNLFTKHLLWYHRK